MISAIVEFALEIIFEVFLEVLGVFAEGLFAQFRGKGAKPYVRRRALKKAMKSKNKTPAYSRNAGKSEIVLSPGSRLEMQKDLIPPRKSGKEFWQTHIRPKQNGENGR